MRELRNSNGFNLDWLVLIDLYLVTIWLIFEIDQSDSSCAELDQLKVCENILFYFYFLAIIVSSPARLELGWAVTIIKTNQKHLSMTYFKLELSGKLE